MSAIWFEKSALAELGRSGSLRATLDIGQLPRVAVAVIPPSDPIEVRSEFAWQGRLLLVDATVSGAVSVACQRCLEPMRIDVDSHMRLALAVADSDMASAPEGYDAVLIADGQLRLADLVEDEILLAIPFSSRHAPGQCGPLAAKLGELRSESETTAPFAGLADLLRDKD